MLGATSSVEGVLPEFPKPIFPKIGGEQTRDGLIELHQLVIRNAVSVSLNLGEGRHGHLALMLTIGKYTAQTGFVFVPPHNPGN